MKTILHIIPGFDWFLEFQKTMVNRIVWPYSSEQDEIFRWRGLILFSILFFGLVLGAFALIAATALVIKENSWGLAIVDIMGLLIGLILLFSHRIRFEIRACITCIICYMIGLGVIIFVGPLSGGPIWLFTFAVIAGVLMGNLAAFLAILVNAVSLISIGLLISTGKFGNEFPFFNTSQAMIATGVNFIVLNTITSVSVSALVKGLLHIFQRKKALASGLEKERFELIKTKQSLEAEIKDRKLAETEIVESEERFRELAEMMPETIFEVNLLGDLTFVNLKAFDLFGFTRQDFSNGINVLELISEKDKDRAVDNITKILQGKDVGVNEYDVQKKDGSFFPALFHSSIIYKKNKPVGFRGFLIDITDQKRTQEILIQSEKMMSVGGLAAGMAHEINNPLAGMIQNAQVLHNRLSKDLPANEKIAAESGTNMKSIKTYMEKRGILQQLEHINSAGYHAAKIVENMLSFAKRNDSIKSAHDLSLLFDKTLDLLKNNYDLKKKYDFKNIQIVREVDPFLPRVLCEETKIQQVLMNIIKNSMDEPMGGNKNSNNLILILRLLKEKNMIRMEIEDNGPGIDREIQKRIFEPFFTTKDVDKGTGLGLSLSYFIIVDDHKGEMEVESTLGNGTKFIIKLPIG